MAAKPPAAQPGDTKKKGKILYRMSSSGKWFKSSNSKSAQKQRDLNTRLNAPISTFQGPSGVLASPTTERDLAHEAQAATNVQYGPQRGALANELIQAVSQRGGTQHWFDDYQQKLQDWRGQVAQQQQDALAAAQRLPGLVQGLGAQQQGVVQGQQAANAAVTGGTPNPQLATDAGQANQVAQAVGANWAGAAQRTGDARNAYAGQMANVIGPAMEQVALQKADQGITDVKSKQTALATQEGNYNQTYRTNRRTDENKNLLAEASLGATSQAKAAANQTAQDRIKASTASAKAAHKDRVAAERDRHATAMQTASTAQDRLKETQRHNKAMEAAKKADAAAKKAKDKKGKGPNWVTPQKQNEVGATAARARSLAHELRVGHPTPQKDKDGKDIYPPGVKPGVKYTRQQAAAVLRQNPKMDEAMLSATLDAAYVGHLSAYTVRKLIQAGYKPSSIASSLGVKTKGQQPKVKRPANIPVGKI